jgi:hypothetical protein
LGSGAARREAREVEVRLPPPPPGAAMAELGWSGRCSVGGVRWRGASAGAEEESEGGAEW